jgi:hypothetical protein
MGGTRIVPDFAHAHHLHRLLHAIQHSAATRTASVLS